MDYLVYETQLKLLFSEYGIIPLSTARIDNALEKYIEVYGRDDCYDIVTDRHIHHRNDHYTNLMERWHIGHSCLYKKLDIAYSRLAVILCGNDLNEGTDNSLPEDSWGQLGSIVEQFEEVLAKMPEPEWEKVLPEDADEMTRKLNEAIDHLGRKVSGRG